MSAPPAPAGHHRGKAHDDYRLNLLAKKWSIEIRLNSATSNPFVHLSNALALSEWMAAISNVRNCVERPRRPVRLPGPPNLCAAARSLGTLPTKLTHQLALERAAGVRLVERPAPSQPLPRAPLSSAKQSACSA